MKPKIFARDIKLSKRLREHVERKTARLDRYMPNMLDLRVDLSEQNARNVNERQVAQMTLRDKHGTILRAEERHADIFAAVDMVVDKLYRQIKRYRDKRKRSHRRQSLREIVLEPLPAEFEDLPDEDEVVVVRRKSFPIQMMPPEEAIDQMSLLGHDFYMFINTEDNLVNVVYLRRDGSFGLLQPEMA